MSGHPWCSDLERDKAVRAAEDATPRPALPEWSELPKRVAALERAVGITPAPASRPAKTGGMRTERVTLEIVTAPGGHEMNETTRPLSEWVPEEIACCLDEERGEYVRVVPSAEADAEIERLRARVAEVEAATKVAETTNGGAGSNQPLLTAEERDAIRRVALESELSARDPRPLWVRFQDAATLRALLARAGGG